MATFQDLPGEIILEILHHTYLLELESVARVDHTLRNLARPIIQSDLELISKITKITRKLKKAKHGGRALVLHDILITPRIAQYVRKLDLRKWFIQWEAPIPELEAQGAYNEYPNDMMDAFRQAVTVEKLVPPSLKDMWIQKVEHGDEAPIIAILCMMLPNLTLLRIDTHVISHVCFQLYLEYILSPASAGHASLAEVFVTDYPTILSDTDDVDTREVYESIMLACQQYSYGPVDYRDIGAGARVVGDLTLRRQSSPMAYGFLSVNFGESVLNIEITKNLTGCVNQLREFYYSSESGWGPAISYVYTLCDYLQTIARETLHVLCIHGSFSPSESWDGPGGSLGGFEMLRTVDIATSFLLDASTHFLAYEFPKSVRLVELHNDLSDGCTIYYELLDELLENKIERLPNLQTLAISGLLHMFEELSESHYTTSPKSIGVELLLKEEDDMPMEHFHNPAIFSSSSRV